MKLQSKLRRLTVGIILAALISWTLIATYMLVGQRRDYSCSRIVAKIPGYFTFETTFRGFVYLGESSDGFDSLILGCGDWESGFLNAIEIILKNLKESSRSKLVAFDVGAHKGTHSLVYSKYADEVFAFEPNPELINKLEDNFKVNKITNVQIVGKGLGDTSASMTFYQPPISYGLVGTFDKEFAGYFTNQFGVQFETITIPVVTGDDFVKEQQSNPIGFIKIDVEGLEKEVLSGLSTTLKRDRPIVFLEFTTGLKHGFTSLEDVNKSLPEKYDLLEVEADNAHSRGFVMHQPSLPARQIQLLAFPDEKRGFIPTS